MPQVQEVPEIDQSESLNDILIAHYRFQFLSAAFESGLFSILADSPGASRESIVDLLGLETQPTRILLLGCTAFELIRKQDGGYYNTATVEPLARNIDELPGAFVPYHQNITYPAMGAFFDSLKENSNVGLKRVFGTESTNLYEQLALDPKLERAFHNAMGGFSKIVSQDLVRSLDLSPYRHLLDVGGGTAVNATNYAKRWTDLEITVLDLPTVAAVANQRIAEAGLEDRVRAIGSDAFVDEYPTGCDCVLFSHFLEIWSIDRIKVLLAKAARAVRPGAGILIITPYQNDEETGPRHAAQLSAYFHAVASGEGMVYTPREYEQWLVEAGFEPSDRQLVGGALEHIVITGIRK